MYLHYGQAVLIILRTDGNDLFVTVTKAVHFIHVYEISQIHIWQQGIKSIDEFTIRWSLYIVKYTCILSLLYSLM